MTSVCYLGIVWPHQQSILQNVTLFFFYRRVSNLSSDSDFDHSNSPLCYQSPIYVPSDNDEVNHKRESSRGLEITSGSGQSGIQEMSSHNLC